MMEQPYSGQPSWCHHHGSRMMLKTFDEESKTIIIKGPAAELMIAPHDSYGKKYPGQWVLHWKIIHSRISKVQGQVFMTSLQLSWAFDLSEGTGKFGAWLIRDYGADSAEQGKYIREGRYLNIPCPGTGHDGDPNISIQLNDEICAAVKKIIKL